MNKNNVIEFAIKTLNSKLQQLKNTIQKEEGRRKEAPNAMQSWSDNTRFEKEVLINRLEEEQIEIEKHIRFLQSLDLTEKTKIEQGALVEVVNIATKKTSFYFISLFAGLELKIEDTKVMLLSENSPITKPLLNKKQGDKVKFEINSSLQELAILLVQ